ncbi:pyridoxal 5'-phosphate synthase-like subunit PDX1.2 [Tanacetum coccineum]
MVNPNTNSTLNQNLNQDFNAQNIVNDPLHIASSDHPGMMLTSTSFNGSNFLAIDGDYQKWICCDYMVTCWILNSMIAELLESFLYAQSARDLWKELEKRYGQSNGPLIYHVERELSKVSQGNSIVAAYFNKLKKFWDELHSLNGIPVCTCGMLREYTCGVTKKFLEIDTKSKLMQFLMRLNDDFEAVRNQILSMDPLPNLNKAYYTSVRKDSRNDGKNDNRGHSFEKKICTHCGQEGHLKDQCFETLGYPDWYKGKKNKKGKMAAQVATDFSPYMPKETPFDFEYENNVQTGSTDLDQRMVAAVCQKMMKMFKRQGLDPSNGASTSQAHAGTYYIGCKPYRVFSFHVTLNVLAKHLQLDLKIDWIVDTGASDHMSPNLHLFHSIRVLKRPIKIRLPDGTSKWVEKVGHIRINSSLTLHNVFYVPDFKVNLLSVGKLLQTQSLIVVFLPTPSVP